MKPLRSSIERAPAALPVWAAILEDLGNPAPQRVAKALGVARSTVYRWNQAGGGPRMACLALFWLTRWGRSEVDAQAVNDAQLYSQLATSLAADRDRLAHQVQLLTATLAPAGGFHHAGFGVSGVRFSGLPGRVTAPSRPQGRVYPGVAFEAANGGRGRLAPASPGAAAAAAAGGPGLTAQAPGQRQGAARTAAPGAPTTNSRLSGRAGQAVGSAAPRPRPAPGEIEHRSAGVQKPARRPAEGGGVPPPLRPPRQPGALPQTPNPAPAPGRVSQAGQTLSKRKETP
jgi:predicted DNA-binding transcriptional regulator AlpA